MKAVTLRFHTVLDLIDFNSVIEHDGQDVDYAHLTIKGTFQEADLELARAGYKAFVVDESQEP